MPAPRRQPPRKRRVSSIISVPDTADESSDAKGKGRPVAKKARSDSAVGGSSRPLPRPAVKKVEVLLSPRKPAPAQRIDPVRDLQRLRGEIHDLITALIEKYEEIARYNAVLAKGKGKGKGKAKEGDE